MSSSQQQPARKPAAIAWDPKCPAALLIPGKPAGDQATAAIQINSVLSHTGVGCNEHEVSALLQLLEAHEAHTSMSPSARTAWNNTKNLSKAYRAALRECLSRWEDHLAEWEDSAMKDDEETPQDLDVENLELLKLVYAITHLSEIFLLPPPAEASLEYYDDPFHIPGAITADTVRYLRHHHTSNAVAQQDPDVLDELMNSLHPDQVGGGKPYWNLMNILVRRGDLTQAWSLLSRHSLNRRAVEATNIGSLDEYDAMMLEKDKVGFQDLRRILLSAPLPGGREDSDDVGLDSSTSESQSSEETLLEGVETSAYQMWETSRTTAEGADFPTSYHPSSVAHKRVVWHQYIVGMDSVKRLHRKIPQLEPIIEILLGKLKKVPFESWAEALLAELIYGNPSILPSNIYKRAEFYMKKYPRMNGEMDDVLLEIMKGNAGTVVQVMQAFGGASGAALPATMTSLLCNLYVDADLILSEGPQFHLLEAGAFAITSSLSSKDGDLAAKLAVRLLLPYAKPGESYVRIVATLADTLERHTPSSDSEARHLLDLCRPLVERKSVRVLDGCVSLVLSRHRSYLTEQRSGGALDWLLKGIELESLICDGENGNVNDWQKVEAISVCYRRLVTWCTSVSGALLRGMLEEREGLGVIYQMAKAMVDSVNGGPLEGYASKLSEVRVLALIVDTYDGMADGNDWVTVARNITLCLQQHANENDDGIVASLAPRSMHWDLLQLGCRIVEADEKSYSLNSSFDVKGIQVLMEQLTMITAIREIEGSRTKVSSGQIEEIKLSLGKGLMRAFVAENAKRKPDRSREADDLAISQIRAIDLNKHSLSTQERVVQKMLDI